MGVANIKLNSLYRQQKSKVSNSQCRHLKEIDFVRYNDYINDSVEEYPTCRLCNHIMDKEDLEERARVLKKFK